MWLEETLVTVDWLSQLKRASLHVYHALAAISRVDACQIELHKAVHVFDNVNKTPEKDVKIKTFWKPFPAVLL